MKKSNRLVTVKPHFGHFPRPRENDPYAIFENVADTLWERTELAIEKNEVARISDDTVAKLMTTALKLYAAKTDGHPF